MTSPPTAPAGSQRPSPLERSLGLFAEVHPGEGVNAAHPVLACLRNIEVARAVGHDIVLPHQIRFKGGPPVGDITACNRANRAFDL